MWALAGQVTTSVTGDSVTCGPLASIESATQLRVGAGITRGITRVGVGDFGGVLGGTLLSAPPRGGGRSLYERDKPVMAKDARL